MASRFLHKPSPLCREVITHMQGLAKAEGFSVLSAAIAEVESDNNLADFMRTRQVKPRGGGHVCVSRLLGKRCDSYNCPNIPYGDHLSEWRQGRTTVAIVSQPYGLSSQGLRQTQKFCERYDLWVSIDTWPSWHYPGRVLSVIFMRKGTYLGLHGLEETTHDW